MLRHLRNCAPWAIVAALVGVAALAWAQAGEPPALAATGDPIGDYVLRLLSGGGLPAVLGLGAWWLRGQMGAGIPVRIELHPTDRLLLRRLTRAAEHREPDSEEPEKGQ